ncbi:hypothetical protein [Thioalkalivibrio sp.]|uniref:hypothetical protein n=1 Tax=Thioalkalivibrio sp. TaxID=2093813 RepID=UPI0035676D2C
MSNAIVVMVIAATAVWVYWDATGHRIGKVPGQGGFFNLSAGAWAVATLILWIVAFPAYLLQRSKLIARAEEYPVLAGGRSGKTAALAGVGGLWTLLSFQGAALATLPACGSAEATATVGNIISDMPGVKEAGIQFVSVNNAREQGYNPETEIRSCSGTLITTAGEDGVQYFVKWQDKAKGLFYVEAQLLE